MALKESGEMYLETIYILHQSNSTVHAVNVAEHMGYSRASVSRGMGLLKEQGYIIVEDDGNICLTEEGLALARKINERHTILAKMFMALGVEEETATEDACRIEHVISDRCFEAVKAHFNNYRE